MDKGILYDLLAKNLSTRQIANRLGKSQTTVRYWLGKHGFVTIPKRKNDSKATCQSCGNVFEYSASKTRGKFCSTACMGRARSDSSKVLIEAGKIDSPPTLKRYLYKNRGNKCEVCNCEPIWNGMPLVMQLDHIDGDSDNNKPENLRLLCPNCHSQTPTYKRGKGSRYRKMSARAAYRRAYHASLLSQ